MNVHPFFLSSDQWLSVKHLCLMTNPCLPKNSTFCAAVSLDTGAPPFASFAASRAALAKSSPVRSKSVTDLGYLLPNSDWKGNSPVCLKLAMMSCTVNCWKPQTPQARLKPTCLWSNVPCLQKASLSSPQDCLNFLFTVTGLQKVLDISRRQYPNNILSSSHSSSQLTPFRDACLSKVITTDFLPTTYFMYFAICFTQRSTSSISIKLFSLV